MRIYGDLYIIICFLAATKSLHLGQYQAFSSLRISGSSKALKQSSKVIPLKMELELLFGSISLLNSSVSYFAK